VKDKILSVKIRSPFRSLSLPQEFLNQEVPENKCKLVYHHFDFSIEGRNQRRVGAYMMFFKSERLLLPASQ